MGILRNVFFVFKSLTKWGLTIYVLYHCKVAVQMFYAEPPSVPRPPLDTSQEGTNFIPPQSKEPLKWAQKSKVRGTRVARCSSAQRQVSNSTGRSSSLDSPAGTFFVSLGGLNSCTCTRFRGDAFRQHMFMSAGNRKGPVSHFQQTTYLSTLSSVLPRELRPICEARIKEIVGSENQGNCRGGRPKLILV